MSQQQKRHREDRGKNNPPIYYVPGQLLLTIEHDGLSADQLVAQFMDTKVFREDQRLAGATIAPGRVITIERARYSDPFYESDTAQPNAHKKQDDQHKKPKKKSFFPKGDGDRPRLDDDEDLRRSETSFVSTMAIELPDHEPTRIPDVVDDLNRAIRRLRRVRQNDLILRGVSPNWFANGVQHNTGGSGPGGRATPATAPTSDNDVRFRLLQMPGLDGTTATAPVDIVILDTAPSQAQLDTARGDPNRNNTLLQRLLGPSGNDGALRIKYADDIAADLGLQPVVLPSDEHYIEHHDFPQPDHGLFVAGIINTIAPNARIYLLEVLGERGVGTQESIERGLLWALNYREVNPDRMLLVNCSLMLVLPPPWHNPRWLKQYWRMFARQDRGAQAEFKLLSLPLEEACYHLRMPASLVVASSGNDGDEPDAEDGTEGVQPGPKKRKAARYPAAFDTVLGVGALKEASLEPASYSNTSDEPEGDGIATFGGEKANDIPESETKVGTGILGVYTGGFPDHPGVAHTGWAWWAGTSFAAPVITGTLAALAGNLGSLQQAQQVLEWSAVTTPSTSGGTAAAFPARQGNEPPITG